MKSTLLVVLAAAAAAAIGVSSAAAPRIHRSTAEKAAFRHLHPCPGGADAGSVTRCRGYVIDHVIPLACGGPDSRFNMQWQTTAEGKAKDRWELKACGRRR